MDTDLQARAEALLARHNHTGNGEAPNTVWLPHTHDQHPNPLVAIVTNYSDGSDDYGPFRYLNVTEINEAKTPWSVKLKAAALKTAVDKLNPNPGQLVAITYEGKKTSDTSGHDYHSFRMTVEDAKPEQQQAFTHPPVKNDDDIPF